jgi:hypothetical protein
VREVGVGEVLLGAKEPVPLGAIDGEKGEAAPAIAEPSFI